jgi:multidrug efflux pump subunit AcrB
VVAALMVALGGAMLTVVGRDFFPAIDGGRIKLHVRVPAETRIEATELIFQEVEDKRSARSFRRAIATSSSTTSGCRSGSTTSPSPTAPPSTSTTA